MIHELNQSAIRRQNSYFKRAEKIDSEIRNLKQKRERLRYPDFENIFKPLIEKVLKELKADGYEIFGPFGLSAERTIYWKKDKDKSITDEGNVLGSLCLISIGDGYAIRNQKKTTNEYPKRSIADLNGCNHPKIDITSDLDYKWLIEFIRRNEEDE